MARPRKPKPDDLLTARMIADEKGWDIRMAESFVRALGRQGKIVRHPDFRRLFVRRRDVDDRLQSGGTTCE